MADDQVQRLMDTFGDQDNPDPLNPDLVDYIEDDGFLPSLRHPLVYSVPYFPGMNRIVNKQYEVKTKAVAAARREHRWSSFVFLHERAYRLDAFNEIADKLTNKEYWELLAHIWIDTENFWQNVEEWIELFQSVRPQRKYLMDEDERKHLRAMPKTVTVYRGFSVDEAEEGLSWTTSKEKARWFALRHTKDGDHPRLATTTIDKEQIIAYMNGRGEDEVILLPESLGAVHIEDA